MINAYLHRTLEPVVAHAARQFPAVLLTGSRQSGKTTMLKKLFGDSHRYVSLEAPDQAADAQHDPRGFLSRNPAPVIIDEAQYAPNLFRYIQERIDANREAAGQFILTGSQNLLLSEKLSESLAGRVAVLELLPLSMRELDAQPHAKLPWESQGEERISADDMSVWDKIWRGGYPELSRLPDERSVAMWQGSYLRTYLERDVRQIRQLGDLTTFQHFLKLMATRSGKMLNITDVSREIGLTLNTVKAWLSVLVATHQVFLLSPYYRNSAKRLVKTPKLYFSDTGLLCYLLGINDAGSLATSALGGSVFETAVAVELFRTLAHRGRVPQLYYWRTSDRHEVDFLVETSHGIVPLEAKRNSTASPDDASQIHKLTEQLNETILPGYVVYSGDRTLSISATTTAVPLIGL